MMATYEALHLVVIRVLRTGFRIAAALLVAGLVISLVRRESLPSEVDPFTKIPGTLIDLRGRAFIDLAIITIVLTPVAAVLTIWRGFLGRGDRRFAGYSLGVLAILLASIILSLVR
jgi:uncharacterized membrane protein